MRGKPKFKIGDVVSFICGEEYKKGTIWIVDAYGTFSDPTDVSYDIMVESENMLYKHINEKYIVKRKRK